MKSFSELLEQIVGVSVRQKAVGTGKDMKIRYRCWLCEDEDRTPDLVQHKHNCLIAQAKDALKAK